MNLFNPTSLLTFMLNLQIPMRHSLRKELATSKLSMIFFFACLVLLPSFTQAQADLLQSGPMLGPVTLRDASIWVQTNQPASVVIYYKEKGSKEVHQATTPHNTDAQAAHTVTVHLGGLKPGATYEYYFTINGKKVSRPYPMEFTTQQHWQFRTDPPNFSFIAGSCFYINDTEFDRPGKPYGGEYEILNHMVNAKPDLMVWLGDNTYFREGDYESRSGLFYRHTHTRSLPELQPFLAATPHYATWDDHDYGPNDSDWTYPLKNHALEAFKAFFPSGSYGAGHTEGVTSAFYWNDCHFIMLDDRWYRSVDTTWGTILGEQQRYWLKETLLQSRAPFKFVSVGGQFLSDFAGFENFANYAEERKEIIEFIDDKKIKGVIFLTGDRHHSEITKLTTPGGITIYDVTSSALTSGTYDHSKEPNTLRVPGSIWGERNFALFNVKGSRKARTLEVKFINTKGKELFSYSFE
jgi:alkaline phosphatase D